MTAGPYRHRYRGWDGAQALTAIHPDDLLAQLGERFLEQEAGQVLDDVLHRGLTAGDGQRLAGVDELRGATRKQLQAIDPNALERSHAAAAESLSDDAGSLLKELLASPSQAGRTLAGARPGLRQELEELAGPAGPLQPGDSLATLVELAELDHALRRARRVADVAEVSGEQIAALLGPELAGQFASLAAALGEFEAQGYVDPTRAGLSTQALRRLGLGLLQGALSEIESRLAGDHPASRAGTGHERADVTRSYRFGDPFDLDLSGTVLQAVRRAPGTPVRLSPRDMTIFEREETGRVALALAIDRSRSMGERGYLLAAKRLGLALTALVHTRYPRDQLDLLAFSHEAEPVTAAELARLEWERYAVGTNIHDALVAGRRKLAAASGLQRTLLLITDGEPTAYRDAAGIVHYSEPPAPEALAVTYAAARRLQRDGILLIVALLTAAQQTVAFAGELVRQAGGRLVSADPDDLNVAMLMGYRSLRLPR